MWNKIDKNHTHFFHTETNFIQNVKYDEFFFLQRIVVVVKPNANMKEKTDNVNK